MICRAQVTWGCHELASSSVHPPVPPLARGGTNLITGLAARAQAFSMMAPTVDFASMVEVDEVNQQLLACGTHEALRVPAGTEACATSKDCNVSTSDLLSTLLTDGPSNGHWEDSDCAPSQILSFPLLAEGPQLFLLFFFQGRAVLCLGVGEGRSLLDFIHAQFPSRPSHKCRLLLEIPVLPLFSQGSAKFDEGVFPFWLLLLQTLPFGPARLSLAEPAHFFPGALSFGALSSPFLTSLSCGGSWCSSCFILYFSPGLLT